MTKKAQLNQNPSTNYSNLNFDQLRKIWLSDPVAFFQYVTYGYFTNGSNSPEPHEAAILKECLVPFNKIALSGGRGGGKTFLNSVILLYMAVVHNKNGIIFSHTTAQADHEMEYIDDLIKRNPVIEGRKLKQTSKGYIAEIVFQHTDDPNKKVTIKVLPEDRLRGEHAEVIIGDEQCEIDDKNAKIAIGNVQNEFLLIISSTPHRADTYFTKVLENPKQEGYKLFTWSLRDLKHWTGMPEKIKEMESRLTPSEQSCEIDGKISLNASSCFDEEKLKKMRDDTLRPMGSPTFLSIDWSHSGKSKLASPTVVMVWEDNGEQGLFRLGVREFKPQKEESNEVIEEIVKMVETPYDGCPGPASGIVADSSPQTANDALRARLGMPRRGDKDPYEEVFFRDCRTRAEGNLIGRLNNGKIKAFVRGTKDQVLIQRKLFLQLRVYDPETIVQEKQAHKHFDHADACLLACYHSRRIREEPIMNPIETKRRQNDMMNVLKELEHNPDQDNLEVLKLLSKEELGNDEKWILWYSEKMLTKLGELQAIGQTYIKDPDDILIKIEDAITQIRSRVIKKKKLEDLR